MDHPRLNDVAIEDVLAALADPARLDIVRALARSGPCTCAGAPSAPLPKATLSRHFKVLRAAGLVRTEKTGAAHTNSLRREEVEARFPGLLAAVLGAEAA